MVVSVEISGVLEEKLRRLVDLGIYASVSEAVRDAVRRMLSDLDLKKVALNILVNKGCSLHYACEFSDSTCPEFIEYLLLRNITPPLGFIGEPEKPNPGESLILDPSSLLIAFSTLAYKAYEALTSIVEISVPSVLENYYAILRALGIKSGLNIKKDFKVLNILELKGSTRVLLTKSEYSIIKYIESNSGVIIVSDDFYIQKYLNKNNIKYYSTIGIVNLARELKMIDNLEYKEILLSLKSFPYAFSYEVESTE